MIAVLKKEELQEKIAFQKVISNSSCYGLIWQALYNNTNVAVKMVVLRSGHYYDHNKGIYKTGHNSDDSSDSSSSSDSSISTNEEGIPKCFQQSDSKPFLHSEFVGKRSMPKKKLVKEFMALSEMHKMGLGPIFYEVFVVKDYEVHYAFLIMELMDCSLKDILLKRPLLEVERNLIKETIDKMHNMGIVHGDLKPSNLGVSFAPFADNINANKDIDTRNEIADAITETVYGKPIFKVNFLDTGKMQHRTALSHDKFNKLKATDLRIYEKHRQKNRAEGEKRKH